MDDNRDFKKNTITFQLKDPLHGNKKLYVRFNLPAGAGVKRVTEMSKCIPDYFSGRIQGLTILDLHYNSD